MVRRRRAALAVLSPLMLAGCGQWAHPYKSPGDFAQDDAKCLQQAIEKVQYNARKEDAPKWMERALGTKTYTVDGNESLRERWHRSCLRGGGWVWRSTASRPSVANAEMAAPIYSPYSTYSPYRYVNR